MSSALHLSEDRLINAQVWITNSNTVMSEGLRAPSLSFATMTGIADILMTFVRCITIARAALIDGAEDKSQQLQGISAASYAIDAGIAAAIMAGSLSAADKAGAQ